MLGLSASLLAGRTIERLLMNPPKNPLVLGQPNSPPRSFSELDEEGNSQLERPVPKSIHDTLGIS